ncbi:GNAT family N-acetyltransferase [Bacillus sp. SD075]|nr:GNAT family N-acetyltransferase [Bacillus sp. SD075]
MDIYIARLKEQDAKALCAFDCNNRRLFEITVPGQGDDYYNFGTFEIRHKELLKEQEDAFSSFYLIKDGSGIIAGRINLVDINPLNGTAHVGYRIGEAFTQNGMANEALKLLVKRAPEWNVTQIHAKTTSDNIASQKVWVKNGFERTSINEEISADSGQ